MLALKMEADGILDNTDCPKVIVSVTSIKVLRGIRE